MIFVFELSFRIKVFLNNTNRIEIASFLNPVVTSWTPRLSLLPHFLITKLTDPPTPQPPPQPPQTTSCPSSINFKDEDVSLNFLVLTFSNFGLVQNPG